MAQLYRSAFVPLMIGAALVGWAVEPVEAQAPKPISTRVDPADLSLFKELLNSEGDERPVLVRHRQDPNAVRPNESLQAAPRTPQSASPTSPNSFGSQLRSDLQARRSRLKVVSASQNRASAMIGDMFNGAGPNTVSFTRLVGDVIPYANPPAGGTNFNGFVGFQGSGVPTGPFYGGPVTAIGQFPQLTTIGIDTNNDHLQDTFPNLLQYQFANGVADPKAIENPGPFDAAITGGKTITTPNGDTVPVLQLTQRVDGLNVPSPSQGGGVVGRMKLAENSSPMPRDRIFFNYNYFNGVPLAPGGINVNRFTPGFEKTLFEGTSSVEVRIPFASTLNTTVTPNGITDGENLEMGNVSLTWKSLIYDDENLLVSAGSMTEIPTADSIDVVLPDGTNAVRVKNEAVHLMPFVGALYTPNERLFTQAFLQFDYGAGGNHVLTNLDQTKLRPVGSIRDTTFVYLDWSTGYWIYLAEDSSRYLTGIAPIFELHLNQSLEHTDQLRTNGNFRIGSNSTNISGLNAVVGTNFQFGASTSMTAAYVTPIGSGADQQFNGEFRLFFNKRFGPQTVQSRAF